MPGMCHPENTFCKRELSEAMDVRGWSRLPFGIGVNDLSLCSFQNHVHPSKIQHLCSVTCVTQWVLREEKVIPASQLIETVEVWCPCSWRKCNTSPYFGHFKAHVGHPRSASLMLPYWRAKIVVVCTYNRGFKAKEIGTKFLLLKPLNSGSSLEGYFIFPGRPFSTLWNRVMSQDKRR